MGPPEESQLNSLRLCSLSKVSRASVFYLEKYIQVHICGGFPDGLVSKESACSAGDPGLIAGSGRFLGEGNGSPLQYSCLGNPMDRGV